MFLGRAHSKWLQNKPSLIPFRMRAEVLMLAFLYTWEINNMRRCPQSPNLQKHWKPRVQHSDVVCWLFPVAETTVTWGGWRVESAMAVGAEGSLSHCIHSQEAESLSRWNYITSSYTLVWKQGLMKLHWLHTVSSHAESEPSRVVTVSMMGGLLFPDKAL